MLGRFFPGFLFLRRFFDTSSIRGAATALWSSDIFSRDFLSGTFISAVARLNVEARLCVQGASDMPSYSNVQPPYALSPGDVGSSFSNEAVPASATAGMQFALPHPAGIPDQSRAVRWQTLFGAAPTAINVSLQGAMADVDAEYKDIDASTAAAGEARTVTGLQANFVRIKVNSSTVGSGSGFTAKLLV